MDRLLILTVSGCVFGAKFDAKTLYPSPKRASLRAKVDSAWLIRSAQQKELEIFRTLGLTRGKRNSYNSFVCGHSVLITMRAGKAADMAILS